MNLNSPELGVLVPGVPKTGDQHPLENSIDTGDPLIVSVTEEGSVGGVFDYPADSVYDQNHVLFREDERYIRKMLGAVLP